MSLFDAIPSSLSFNTIFNVVSVFFVVKSNLRLSQMSYAVVFFPFSETDSISLPSLAAIVTFAPCSKVFSKAFFSVAVYSLEPVLTETLPSPSTATFRTDVLPVPSAYAESYGRTLDTTVITPTKDAALMARIFFICFLISNI